VSWSQRRVFRWSGDSSELPLKPPERTSDVLLVIEHDEGDVSGPLATVIPISAVRAEVPVHRDAEILDRRVGPGWEGIAANAGRPGLRLEHLVRQAPCGYNPAITPALTAVTRAGHLVHGARTALDLLADEVATLSEGLGADLATLSLDELDAVAASVVSLGNVPRTVPAWGHRAAADGAALVLDLIGPDLRKVAQAHERLYERFTDHVWEVPASRLAAGRRRWRVIARRRLSHELRAASRTGTVPGGLGDVASEIMEVRVMRAELAPVRPLLATHLGSLDRGVLTDVEAAVAALAAVRDLQRALGMLLDDERMERLLLADAFRTGELLVPARSIRTTLAAWSFDVAVAGGRGAFAVDGDTLEAWADEVAMLAPALTPAVEHLGQLRPAATLKQAVDAFVLREHLAEIAASEVLGADDLATDELRSADPASDDLEAHEAAPAGADRSWSAS
jgi:hypothetical protein